MRKGFSLLEILLVLAFFGGLFLFTIQALNGFGDTKALDTGTVDVAAVLSEARAKSIGSVGTSSYGVHFASSTVTLFKGETYTSSDPNNQVTTLSTRIFISVVALANGGSDVHFERLTGKASTTGTIVITSASDSTKTRTITIEGTGLVRVATHITIEVMALGNRFFYA